MNKSTAIIRKEGNKWVLYSHKGKRLGTFTSREAALKRERQINYFKHQKGSLDAVIAFLNFYGHDFEPLAFKDRSFDEYVEAAKKAKKMMDDEEEEHEEECDAKKKKHMTKCADDIATSASMVKQSVIVKKGEGCATSREEATAHAKKHGVTKTIRETGSSYRFRQRPPGDFDKSTFRTIAVSKCVSYVVGKLKGAK